MRAVVQRVLKGRVEADGQIIGQIGKGLLVYLSVGRTDTAKDAQYMADKLVNLRIFADEAGKMNRSVLDVGCGILLVSNFTVHGDCRKGRRPGFDGAAEAAQAEKLYEEAGRLIAEMGAGVEKGAFGEHMEVSSINDGPVTLLLDSSRLF